MSTQPPRILIIEDERAMREMLTLALEREGYEVRALANGLNIAETLRISAYNVIILDIGLPGVDGISLISTIRTVCDTPILMFTARNETSDKVRALQLGADHYLTKPIEIDELLARISAALRRPTLSASSDIMNFASLEMNCDNRQVSFHGISVDLTPREFSVLEVLMRTPGRAFSKAELLERVWGIDHDGDWSIVDRYISYIRSKLEARRHERLIQTVRGIGYSLRQSTNG